MTRVLRPISSKLFIVLIPVMVTVFLVFVRFHASLLDFVPSWNDEVFYWHQTASFHSVGFDNGYYVFDEVPARAGFSHYGPHGPIFPAIYGTLGRVLGWHLFSGPIFNLVLLALAILVFLCNTPAQQRHRLKLGLILLTFWPVLLYLPSNMQESLHAAAAIVFAAVFYRLISQRGTVTTLQIVLLAGLIFVFALMRPIWSLLFLPLFLYRPATSSVRNTVFSCIGAAFLAAVVFIVFQSLSAPYENTMTKLAGGALDSNAALKVFVRHFIFNARVYIDYRYVTPLESSLHYQTILSLLALLTLEGLRRLAPGLSKPLKRDEFALFHLLNLGIPLMFVLLFYDITGMRDYRVMAPHILISLLLWSAAGKSRLVYLMTATNLLCILFFASTFSNIHFPHFNRSSVPETPWSKVLKFQPQESPWCNTMLTDAPLDEKFLSVPAGIGLSFTFNAKQMPTPIKSQYMLLTPKGYSTLKERIHVEFIMKTAPGDLYRNLDCQCGTEGGR